MRKETKKAKPPDSLLKISKKDIESTENELGKVSEGETAKHIIDSIGR
jgi:hypothetical protein